MQQCSQPLISICVPIYNVEAFIERCALSLFEQSYNNIEYIFVDDCSTDNSLHILKNVINRYKDLKEKVFIYCHDKNRGSAASRNTCIEKAQGEFVMFVDSDDWIEVNATELLVQKQIETNADIVSGNAYVHYSTHDAFFYEPSYSSKEEMLLKMIEITFDHVLWRRIIRTSLFKDNNTQFIEGYNIGEDHYTLPKLIYYSNRCEKINDIIYHYNRKNGNSYLSSKSKEFKSKRFISDISSLNILIVFFKKRNRTITNKLKEIKVKQCYKYVRILSKEGAPPLRKYVAIELLDCIYPLIRFLLKATLIHAKVWSSNFKV